jgi:hypothetical protein
MCYQLALGEKATHIVRSIDTFFLACCLVFLVHCQVFLESISLAPSYLHTPQHTWLIPKFRWLKMDLDSLLSSLGFAFKAKF